MNERHKTFIKFVCVILLLLISGCSQKKDIVKNDYSMEENKSEKENNLTYNEKIDKTLYPFHIVDEQGNKKWGYLDKNCEIKIECNLSGDEAYYFDPYNLEYAIIENSNGWFIINRNGDIVLDCNDNTSTLYSAYVDQNRSVIVCEDEKFYKLSMDGSKKEIQYYPVYINYQYPSNPNATCYKIVGSKENKYACLNSKGEELFLVDNPFLFPFKYEDDKYDNSIGIMEISNTAYDYTTLTENNSDELSNGNKYCYIDSKGNKLFDGELYDTAHFFTKKGYAVVTKNDTKYIINTDGKIEYELKEDELYTIDFDGNIYITYGYPYNVGLKNIKEEILIEPKYREIECIYAGDGEDNPSFIVCMIEDGYFKHKILNYSGQVTHTFDEFNLAISLWEDQGYSIENLKSWIFPGSFVNNNRFIFSGQVMFDSSGNIYGGSANLDSNSIRYIYQKYSLRTFK